MDSVSSQNATRGQVVVRLVKDLDLSVRVWISSLFGRELADDEQVAVGLPDLGSEPIVVDGAQARRQLLESLDRLSGQFQGTPDDQLEAALDRALKAARPAYDPQQGSARPGLA